MKAIHLYRQYLLRSLELVELMIAFGLLARNVVKAQKDLLNEDFLESVGVARTGEEEKKILALLYVCLVYSYFSLIHNFFFTNIRLRLAEYCDKDLISWRLVNYLFCRKPGFVGDSTPKFCETCCQDRGFMYCFKDLIRMPLFAYTVYLCDENIDESKKFFRKIIPILVFLGFQNIIFGIQAIFSYLVALCLEDCIDLKPVPQLIDTRLHFVTHNQKLQVAFHNHPYSDHIISSNYEVFCYFDRIYQEPQQSNDHDREMAHVRRTIIKKNEEQSEFGRARKTIRKSFRMKQAEPCMICYLDFDIDCDVTILGCDQKHFLHTECINQWISHHKSKGSVATCPLCRLNIDESKMKKVTYRGLESEQRSSIRNPKDVYGIKSQSELKELYIEQQKQEQNV